MTEDLDRAQRRFVWVAIVSTVHLLVMIGVCFAHDPDSPELNWWYESLMQPDVPNASCCGIADAYFADEVHVRDGKTFAVITDDRPDAERNNRRHVPVGTEIEIPTNKLKWNKGNPTGHGVVFMSKADYVYCYVQPGGV